MIIESSIVCDIDEETIDSLKQKGEHIVYNASSNLFYEGQTPVVAYLVLSGNIHLVKNKKVKKTIGAHSLIGVQELMLNKKSEFSATIMPESEICFLSRSDINEILETQDELADKVTQLLAV